MKKQDFIDGLCAAGWESTHDAQHRNIEKLWRMVSQGAEVPESWGASNYPGTIEGYCVRDEPTGRSLKHYPYR